MKTNNKSLLHILLFCLCVCIVLLVGCDETPDTDAHEHTIIEHEGQVPTCDKEGWIPYKTCATCDEYSTYCKLAALGHDYSSEYVQNGDVHTRSCTRCDSVITEAHDWIAGAKTAPTCIASGSQLYECTLCGAEKSESISLLGHDYVENKADLTLSCTRCSATIITHSHVWETFEVITEPTCTNDGAESIICTACIMKKTEILPAIGHDFADEYEPNGDVHSLFCSRCSETALDLPHTWQQKEITENPSCTEEGAEILICTVCGAEKDGIIAALGHDFKDEYEPNGDVHSLFCSRCPETALDLPHTWRQKEITENPSCTEEGAEILICTVCGAEKDGIIAPLGHDYADDYQPNGDVHSRFCSRCTVSTDDKSHSWQIVEVTKEPNCTSEGKGLYACTTCGAEKTETLPIAHASGEWVTITAATALTAGSKLLRCSSCHQDIRIERIPADVESMPIIYLDGEYQNATNAKNEVDMTVTYINPNGDQFQSYATIKVQGSSSKAYDKKNYTIKFFKDSEHDEKFKYDFGWGKQSKYVMKANWVDFSQARNVVSCRLWGDLVKSRPASEIQERLAALATNGGAIDGFPIAVFMNGEFHGLYTMNVPKDEWMFGMGEKDENGNKSTTEALIAADDWNHTDFYSFIEGFKEDSAGDLMAINGGWELRYYGGDDYAWVAESFDALIKFCQDNDADAFRAGISEHLDVDAAIDYVIYMYANCMHDNASKNMLWATYDGKVWIPSAYDQDGTFGQVWDGVRFSAPNSSLPSVKNDRIDVGINYGPSVVNTPRFILWDRIWNCFTEEVLERYWELRATVLSEENMIAELSAFKACIPDSMFEADFERWRDSRESWWAGKNKKEPYDYNAYHYEYMYQWIADRMSYYDGAIQAISDYYYSK